MKIKPNTNCEHKAARIIVVAAFAGYEKTKVYCPTCNNTFDKVKTKKQI